MFLSPNIDLSVGVQTASRAPFVFVFSGIHHRKGTCKRMDFERKSDVGERGRFRSTEPVGTKGEEHWKEEEEEEIV